MGKHTKLVTEIYENYNGFMGDRGVHFGGQLSYHYKDKLTDANKNILINYPLYYPIVRLYEVGERKLYKQGTVNDKKTDSTHPSGEREIYLGGSWADYTKDTYITATTESFEVYNVKDYRDLIDKLVSYYTIHRKHTKQFNRIVTDVCRVNESTYRNPRRRGAYPEHHFILEYYDSG